MLARCIFNMPICINPAGHCAITCVQAVGPASTGRTIQYQLVLASAWTAPWAPFALVASTTRPTTHSRQSSELSAALA